MSPSWGQFVNPFGSNSPPKLMLLLRKYDIYPSLCIVFTFEGIEQLTSTWAHFKEQTQLFKMSPSWGQLLNSFRSDSPPKLMLLLRKRRIYSSLWYSMLFSHRHQPLIHPSVRLSVHNIFELRAVLHYCPCPTVHSWIEMDQNKFHSCKSAILILQVVCKE